MSSGSVLASLMTTSAYQIVHISSSLRFMRLATVGSGIAMPPVPTAIAPLAKRGTCQVDADHHHATNDTRNVARKSRTLGEVTVRTYLGLPNPGCWVRLTSSASCA